MRRSDKIAPVEGRIDNGVRRRNTSAIKRHILGLMAANIAAPYLVALLITTALLHDSTLKFAEPFGPFEIFKFIPIGTHALILFGAPLLLLSGLYAFLLSFFECRTWRGPVIGGAIFGLCLAFVFDDFFNAKLLLLVTGILPGAICGWIYWRIALRPKMPDRVPKRGISS